MHRSVTDKPVEIRAEGDRRVISGYAAVFNSLSHDLGGYRETISPKAFNRTLREIAEGKRSVAARIQHEGGLSTVGTTTNGSLVLSIDGVGLKYDIVDVPDTSAGRDLLTLVGGGYISKSSFAFSIPNRDIGVKWDFNTTPPTRELLDVDLIDVAPVDGPAYEATSVEARSAALAEIAEHRADTSRVELFLLDEIVPTWVSRYMTDATSSGKVIEALAAVPDASSIEVYINSPGGDVFEAQTIYNTLKEHPAPVNVHVRGLAASAAGIVAMAGDTITMGEGAFLMVHNAWTVAQGNAGQLRDQAMVLDKVDNEIASILAGRSKNDIKQVKKWMAAETWFTADEALAAGLATRKLGAAEAVDGERCRQLGYRNVPREIGGPGGLEYRSSLSTAEIAEIISRKQKNLC